MALEYKLPAARAQRLRQLDFDPQQLPHERILACDLCETSVFRRIARSDRYGFARSYQMCECCGLVFQSPRPTVEGYATFYRDIYRPLVSAFKGKRETPQTIQAEQRTYAARLTEFLAPHVTALHDAADLGGSTGVIAVALRESFGGNWLVVDPAPDEVAVASELGLQAEVGTAEAWEPDGRTYDLILICRSIDHCLSITRTLQKVHDALSPGGLFFIDLVDFGSLAKLSEDFRRYLKMDHTFYLSDETMRSYFAKIGFDVIATDASVYQFAYLVRKSTPKPQIPNGHAAALGTLLRECVLTPPTKPYPVDLLTRVARAAKKRFRG